MSEQVQQLRFTVVVHTLPLESKQGTRVDQLVELFFRALFPLGLAPGYPDVQVIEDGPFGER